MGTSIATSSSNPAEAKAYGVVDHAGDKRTPASQLTATPASPE
jgi:hypothetical protein